MNSGQEQSERTKAEHIPPIDQLRGPNSTLRLAGLLEESLEYSGGERAFNYSDRPTILQNAVSELNRWAEPIDSKVRIATGLKPPHNKIELEQAIKGLIGSHAIPSTLDLWQILMYHGKNHLAVQDQWHLVKALFGIDTSLLAPGYAGGQSLPLVYDQGKVHEIMFGLIERAVQPRGGSIEMVTDERGTNDTPRLSFKAPSLIDGITPEVTIRNIGINRKNSNGYPSIIGVSLGLSSSFLASVRPLRGEDYQKYSQRQESQHSEGEQGNEGFKRGPEGQDPRDPKGYYKTLGINPDTDPEDIQDVLLATYRRLSRKYHSDTGGEKADEGRMKAINAAYEFLNNTGKRKNYGRDFN